MSALPRRSEVTVHVYDVGGRRVRALLAGSLEAGTHTVRWDGRDEDGARVAAGIYLIRARAGGEEQNRKVTVVR
jgi:flagellar hook assembly protein FlgD